MEKINNKYLTNYQKYLKELEDIKNNGVKKKILIHACCAPCSSEVLEQLETYFDITLYYYNPNIYPIEEFQKRYDQFEKLPFKYNIRKGEYNEQEYYKAVKGYEHLKEFSERCYKCFYFRMEDTAKKAKEMGYDYFSTTLSISPYKKSEWINDIGRELEKKYEIRFLYSDFKKMDGYKKSIALSKKYNLYRQEYCGCAFSKKEQEEGKTKN